MVLTNLDAGVVLKAQLPVPERRGLILIDPPYEVTDEIQRTERAAAEGLKRFATGVYAEWDPITGDKLDEKLGVMLKGLGAPMLKAEVRVRRAVPDGGLAGSGLYILNPPYQLDEELKVLVPALGERLKQGAGAGWAVG